MTAQVFLVECQVSGVLHVEFARRRFRRFEEAMLSNQLVFLGDALLAAKTMRR